MALSLERRVENALKAMLAGTLSGSPQIMVYDDTVESEKQYYSIRADRVEEDPPSSGIWSLNVTVIAHGQFDTTELDLVESLLSHGTILSTAIRTEAVNHDFQIVAGDAVDIGTKSKAGAGLDSEYRYEFGLWAQKQEHADAA